MINRSSCIKRYLHLCRLLTETFIHTLRFEICNVGSMIITFYLHIKTLTFLLFRVSGIQTQVSYSLTKNRTRLFKKITLESTKDFLNPQRKNLQSTREIERKTLFKILLNKGPVWPHVFGTKIRVFGQKLIKANVWFCVFKKLRFPNWWICAFSERRWWVAFSKTLVFNINLPLLSHSFMFTIPKIPKQNCIMTIKFNQILIPLLLILPSFVSFLLALLPSCFLAIAQPQLSLKVFHALNLLEIHEHVFNDLGKKLMGKASGTV